MEDTDSSASESREPVAGPPDALVESKLRQEAFTSIKDGTDIQGGRLFEAYKESLDDPEASSFTGETYKKAKKSFENIDNEGEPNKLVASMDALYRQAGLEEGYKPKIEYEGELSGDEKQRLIREKVTEDFQNYPEIYAESKIGRYVEAKARIVMAENKATELVDKDLVRRVDLRVAVFQVQQERTGLFSVVEEETKQIKKDGLGEEMVEGIKGEWEFVEKPLEKNFSELEEGVQDQLIEQRVDEYKEVNSEADERHVKAVDSLTGEEKKNVFGKIAENRRKIQNKKENLKAAILNSPENAFDIISDVRSLQVEQKLKMSEAVVTVAKKRTEISKGEWKDAAGDVLSGYIKGKGQKEGVWKKFKGSTKDWIQSKKDEVGRRIGREVKDTVADLDEGTDRSVDKFRVFYRKIDDKLISRVRKVREKASLKLKGYNENMRDSGARVKAEEERKKILIRKTYYRSRHKTEKSFREAMVTVGVGWRSSKETMKLNLIGKASEIVGSEKVKGNVKRRREVLKRFDRMHETNVKQIRESQNSHMDVFKEDLEERFQFVQKVVETPTQDGNETSDRQTREAATTDTEGEFKDLSDDMLVEASESEEDYFMNSYDRYLDREEEGGPEEQNLSDSGGRLLGLLIEINRRQDEKLTPEVIKTLADQDIVFEGIDTKLKLYAEQAKTTGGVKERAERVYAYSRLLGIKSDNIKTYS